MLPLSGLKPGQLYELSRAFIRHPLYIIPTWKATRRTMNICTALYGKNHHYDNRTNAFRHALWNFLICRNCFSLTGSAEKALNWSKKITDLHEDLFPNEKLSRSMDLHNNYVGRNYFENHPNIGEDVAISFLQKEMLAAVKITNLEDIKKAGNRLVFIEKLKEHI